MTIRQDPYNAIVTATPSDTVNENLGFNPTGIIAVTAGNVSFETIAGYSDTVTLAAGELHPVQVKRINLAGTNATVKIVGQA